MLRFSFPLMDICTRLSVSEVAQTHSEIAGVPRAEALGGYFSMMEAAPALC